jgi:hypothetical protein
MIQRNEDGIKIDKRGLYNGTREEIRVDLTCSWSHGEFGVCPRFPRGRFTDRAAKLWVSSYLFNSTSFARRCVGLSSGRQLPIWDGK